MNKIISRSDGHAVDSGDLSQWEIPMVKSMDQFLQYENELAPGSGFELWSLSHILWLLVLGLIAAVAFLGAKRCGGRGKRWIRSTFAICALLMQVLPSLLIMWKGMYSKYTLPAHMLTCKLCCMCPCAVCGKIRDSL